jgi:hypothetical protein
MSYRYSITATSGQFENPAFSRLDVRGLAIADFLDLISIFKAS